VVVGEPDPWRFSCSLRKETDMTATTNGTAMEGSVGQPSSERITVALIPRAVADLQHLQDRTGLSKTDLVNRAITLYEFIEGQVRAGQDLLLRNRESGDTQLVRLIM
jgi:hypothetical protein